VGAASSGKAWDFIFPHLKLEGVSSERVGDGMEYSCKASNPNPRSVNKVDLLVPYGGVSAGWS